MVLGEYRTRITLADQGDRCVLTGLIDTGNHLTEPMTGRPVSIVGLAGGGKSWSGSGASSGRKTDIF